MKKKVLSMLLAVSMISASPVFAAEFSDGSSIVMDNAGEGNSAEKDLSASQNEDSADSSAEIGNPSLFSDSSDSANLVDSFDSLDSAAAAENPVFSDQLIPAINDYSDLQAAGSVRDDTVSSSNTYNITVEGTLIRSEAAEFVRLVNEARAERGVKPLTLDQRMQDVSDQRAIHMSVMYGHHFPGADSSRLWHAECACGGGYGKTAGSFFEAWKSSSAHWGILMSSRYEALGFSIFDNDGSYYGAVDLYRNQSTYPDDLSDETSSFSFNIEKDYINTNYKKNTYSMMCNSSRKIKLPITNEYTSAKITSYITCKGGIWESSAPGIASVDNDGNVTAVSPGTATIRYYVNGSRDYSFDTTINVVSIKAPEIQAQVNRNSPFVNLKWDLTKDVLDNENSMGYQIFVYDPAVGEYTLYNEVSLDSEDFDEEYFTGMTVGYGATKKIKIRLYMNQDGIKAFGDFSNEVTFSTSPSRPEMKSVTMKNKKAYLKWTKSENADGYAIFRRIGKTGSYKRIKTINSGDVVKYTNSKLTYGKKYCYKVKAFYVTPEGKRVYTSYSNTKSKTCR